MGAKLARDETTSTCQKIASSFIAGKPRTHSHPVMA
ncbi:hypothetical protein SRABI112_00981 [Pseudomonas mediterranea]|nr:hypothetical protein SRABI112_00981 [Pseudomonas mediterranea]